MPRRRPPLSFLLLLSFLFVSLVFFSNKSENKRNTLEDFAFETSQELFSGTWRNVVAFDSKSIRERERAIGERVSFRERGRFCEEEKRGRGKGRRGGEGVGAFVDNEPGGCEE